MLRIFEVLSFIGLAYAHVATNSALNRVSELIEKRYGSAPIVRSLLSRVGPSNNMQDVFKDLQQMLRDDVESRIVQDHQDTQKAIDAAVEAANASSVRVTQTKAVGDSGNRNWAQCIADEKKVLEAHEKATSELPALIGTMNVTCAKQESLAVIRLFPETVLSFNCKFSTSEVCGPELKSFQPEVDAVKTDVRSQTDSAVNSYVEAKRQCEAATQAHDAKVKQISDLGAQWRDHRRSCHAKRASRETSICAFGVRYQEKCAALSHYQSLDAAIDASPGNEYSHPDREQEWQVTQLAKCLVGKFADGSEMVESDLTGCQKAVNFATDVGVLNKKKEAIAAFRTSFSCSASSETISFAGGTWEIPPHAPDGNVPASADYKFVAEYSIQASLSPGGEPFPFC